MDQEVAKVYGNKVRVRACGLCWQNGKLLMVNHAGITPGNFWAPPGGGIEFGLSAEETVVKEFREETGLRVVPGRHLFTCEYIQAPIHSIELFFAIESFSGEVRTGHDPELQIIKASKFLSVEEIKRMAPVEVHGIFREISSVDDLKNLSGFFRI